MGVPLVEVLMSTYNGEHFLRQQIDSILGQEGVRVRLVVRDDGSADGTLDILGQYASDPRVRVHAGENLGLPHAFFRLIQESSGDADYWALADQDDVWLPHKLTRATERLEDKADRPALYCARVLAVDTALTPLGPHPLPKRGPSFENALVQNIATGCTIVMNAAARGCVRNRWPDYAVMHDAWLYLAVSGTGTVTYDPEIVVLYRQHSGNAVGLVSGPVRGFLDRLRRQMRQGRGAGAHTRQNAELLRTHGTVLRPQAFHEVNRYLGANGALLSRAEYAMRGRARRQTWPSDLVRRVLFIAGRT